MSAWRSSTSHSPAATSPRSTVAWLRRRGGPVRIHVRAKDLRCPSRAEAMFAAVDATHVTPTTYGQVARRAA